MTSKGEAIEFFCEFASPYGYLAATRIGALAERVGRPLVTQPVLLGPIFKQTGAIPLAQMPLKGDYMARDAKRFARLLDEPLGWPPGQPANGLLPARAYHAVAATDPEAAWRLYMALYEAYWVDERPADQLEEIARIAPECGHHADDLMAAMASDAVKAATRDANDKALAKGVFGSPYIIADGEPFWGADRLDQAEAWIAQGGW